MFVLAGVLLKRNKGNVSATLIVHDKGGASGSGSVDDIVVDGGPMVIHQTDTRSLKRHQQNNDSGLTGFGVPESLRPTSLIGQDDQKKSGARTLRRSIIATDSSLGRIFLIELLERDEVIERNLYSGDHLVVSSKKRDMPGSVTSMLSARGLKARKPFPGSDLIYVDYDGDSPAELMRVFGEVRDAVGQSGFVELDGVGSGGQVPSDPYYSSQWHHRKIESPSVWEVTEGSPTITVAVLDTGLNTSLAEFQGRLEAGYDYVNGDNNPMDDHGHGTAVAGTLAANANNGTLVAGVDWHCRLMPIKVLGEDNYGYYSWWAAGMDYAVAHGARVINLSAGGFTSSSALETAIDNGISQGCIIVTITGNDGLGSIQFPGRLFQAITVGATERDDTKTDFSNWGPAIDLTAPGRDIYTVGLYGGVEYWWGTSFSAPQVSGAAALLLAINPSLDQESVATLLTFGAEDEVGRPSEDVAGFDYYHGWGRLNILNSLILAQTTLTVDTTETGNIRLNWKAPENASSKQPYRIRFSNDGIDWTFLPSPSISYGLEAEWMDDGSATAGSPQTMERRFYQIVIGQ